MKVLLIRHGATKGNLAKRYIGRTDEALCPQGVRQAQALCGDGRLAAVDKLFCSPMRRCVETAAILFPHMQAKACDGLRECDFGVFEGKTADELKNNAAYNAWLATGCTEGIPGLEGPQTFFARCARAFEGALGECAAGDTAAFVAHGGVMMAILAAYALPRQAFYKYHIGNCGVVLCACAPGPVLRVLDRWQPC
ncbi:MAG: histidine phosphatase family protein [Clostridiales bacterium]|nr:histidine phosphatase family protein [Clostridiales bacterium]